MAGGSADNAVPSDPGRKERTLAILKDIRWSTPKALLGDLREEQRRAEAELAALPPWVLMFPARTRRCHIYPDDYTHVFLYDQKANRLGFMSVDDFARNFELSDPTEEREGAPIRKPTSSFTSDTEIVVGRTWKCHLGCSTTF